MLKLRKAGEEKREMMQKMEWSEKFWKDKLVTMEREHQTLQQRLEVTQDQLVRAKEQSGKLSADVADLEKSHAGVKEEHKKKDAQISDMTRQMTYLMKSMEESKSEQTKLEERLKSQAREREEMKLILEQQKEVIRQQESALKESHMKSVHASDEAVSKWTALQSQYELVSPLFW